jgi:hypothetical protein
MNDPIDWQHRDSLRMWRVLAAHGHTGAQAVTAHYGLAPLPVPALAPAPRPTPASVNASVPRPPRAVTPTAPPPTVALTGVQRRVDMLTKLISPPEPPDLF